MPLSAFLIEHISERMPGTKLVGAAMVSMKVLRVPFGRLDSVYVSLIHMK